MERVEPPLWPGKREDEKSERPIIVAQLDRPVGELAQGTPDKDELSMDFEDAEALLHEHVQEHMSYALYSSQHQTGRVQLILVSTSSTQHHVQRMQRTRSSQ